MHTLEHLIELEGVGDIGEPLGRLMVAELAYHLAALTGDTVIEADLYRCGAVCEDGHCYSVASYAAEVNVLEAKPAVFICKACASFDAVADVIGLNGVKSAKYKLVGIEGSCAQSLACELQGGKDMVLLCAVLAERSQEELAVALAANCNLAVFNGNYLGDIGLNAENCCDPKLNIICVGRICGIYLCSELHLLAVGSECSGVAYKFYLADRNVDSLIGALGISVSVLFHCGDAAYLVSLNCLEGNCAVGERGRGYLDGDIPCFLLGCDYCNKLA